MRGSELCFTHNPKTKTAHLEAARRGGNVGRNRESASSSKEPYKLPETSSKLLRFELPHETGYILTLGAIKLWFETEYGITLAEHSPFVIACDYEQGSP